MALTIPHPHLHHPHTGSENFMISAMAIAVAAMAAFGVYQIVDTNTQAVPNSTSQVESFSPELTRANARQADAFQAEANQSEFYIPDFARVPESTTGSPATQAAAGPNPAEQSATGRAAGANDAIQPVQGGIR